jgi:hypothetical protein
MMHPEMASALARQHRHDLTSQAAKASQAVAARRGHPRGGLLPRYRLSWSRATLPAVAGGRRGRSWVIVISASRAL